MQLSPEQQKAIEEQKANCPFCKIIKGEIPSKKVYEDDSIIVILDINPATKGHMLVMPKEHYPIMPLIPKEVFNELFLITKKMSGLCESALISHGSNVFIANGGAAGQQSQHFMLHVIPRDKNDGLDNFNLALKDHEEKNYDKTADELSNNLKIIAARNLGSNQASSTQQNIPREYSDEQLIGIIEANPQLLEAILKQPEEFKTMVPKHQQLSVLFRNKDINSIIEKLLKKHTANQEKNESEEPVDESKESVEDNQSEEEPVDDGENPEEKKSNLDDIADLFK